MAKKPNDSKYFTVAKVWKINPKINPKRTPKGKNIFHEVDQPLTTARLSSGVANSPYTSVCYRRTTQTMSTASSVSVLRVGNVPVQHDRHVETDEHCERVDLVHTCEQDAESGQHRDSTFCLDDSLVVALYGFCLQEAESTGQCAHGKIKGVSYKPQSTPDLVTVELYCATGPGEEPLSYPHNRFNLRADQEGTVWKRLPTTERREDSMCLGDLITYMDGEHTVNNPGVGTDCLTSHNNWRSGIVYSQ